MNLSASRAVQSTPFKSATIVARITFVVCSLVAGTAWAQDAPEEPPPTTDAEPSTTAGSPDAAAAEIKRLQEQIDELEEQNVDLREDVEDLYSTRKAPTVKPASLNVMNPQITVFANGAARIDDATVLTPDGVPIDDGMFLRTAEFDFRAAIDPYADGVVTLAVENEAGSGFSAELEEAFLILKRLPILESAPLGLKLKLGKFRAAIGSSNRMHMHDMPWTTRPLPIVKFLGSENGSFFESGFNPEGIDAEFLLPELIPGVVMEFNLDLLDAHDIALTENDDGWNAALASHFNLFFSVADAHDFNLGFSGYYEGGRRHATLVVSDFLYKWKPNKAGEFRSLVLGGEFFYADRTSFVDPEAMPGVSARSKPMGYYGFAQYQLSWNLYAGARYDYSQEIAQANLGTQVFAAYATYYTSEFLRLRAGYEHRESDIAADDGLNSLFFDISFVIGSHPTEPYWVNR